MTDKYTLLATIVEVKKGLSTRAGKADLYKVLPHRADFGPKNLWRNEGESSSPLNGCKIGDTIALCITGEDKMLQETELTAIPMAVYEARNAS